MLVQEIAVPGSEVQTRPQRGKILVVDDSAELLKVLKQVLELSGFEVNAANDVRQALTHLTTHMPDIIICDVMMPEVNGFEFHLQIKQSSEWCDIPFVFLTALADAEHVRSGKQAGCDDYLTKPFDPDELLAVVEGKIAVSRQRQTMQHLRMEGYRRRIIHTLSHEFRTPLVSINTGTELLAEQLDTMDMCHVERLLGSIRRGGQRLERLVNDFMMLQQIDLGHAEAMSERYRRRVSLVAIAETAVDCFREVFPESGSMVSIEPPQRHSEPPVVDVYDVQVVNIVQRLLHNAFKFSGANQTVKVSVRTEGKTGEIIVRDFGSGLNASTEEACELFSQIDRETKEQQGCGLGLTISTYFARMNRGTVSLRRPAEGKGTEAVIAFPLVSD